MTDDVDFAIDESAIADVSHILDDLNEAQREAVTTMPSHMLVLAGAGSGKTRVLVHRIAWLCQVEGASPFNIFAVTFTVIERCYCKRVWWFYRRDTISIRW